MNELINVIVKKYLLTLHFFLCSLSVGSDARKETPSGEALFASSRHTMTSDKLFAHFPRMKSVPSLMT